MKLKIDLKLKIKNLKLAPAFPVIARAMSAARGNLAKRLKRSRRLQISLVTLAIFTPLALLGLLASGSESLPPGWKPFRAGSRLGEFGREKAIDNLIEYSHVLSLSAKELKRW